MAEIHSRGSQMQDITGHGNHFLSSIFEITINIETEEVIKHDYTNTKYSKIEEEESLQKEIQKQYNLTNVPPLLSTKGYFRKMNKIKKEIHDEEKIQAYDKFYRDQIYRETRQHENKYATIEQYTKLKNAYKICTPMFETFQTKKILLDEIQSDPQYNEEEKKDKYEKRLKVMRESVYLDELNHIAEYMEQPLSEKYKYPPTSNTIKNYLVQYLYSILLNDYHDEKLRQQDITNNIQTIKGIFDEFQKYMDDITNNIIDDWNIDKEGIYEEKWFIKLVHQMFDIYMNHKETYFEELYKNLLHTAQQEWKKENGRNKLSETREGDTDKDRRKDKENERRFEEDDDDRYK